MTWTEQRLWKELRKLEANFRRQASIGPYFADFATHNPKLVIEVDGGVHERLPDVAARDLQRQAWLETQGYVVLRFTDRQVSGDVFECIEVVRGQLDRLRPAPTRAQSPESAATPPSPALPPSRRKGELA
jgi:very-short-patch-repair endonuclease